MNLILFAFFLLATLSHAYFLNKSKNSSNKQSLWKFHYFFNSILWVILIFLIIGAQFNTADIFFPNKLRILGVLLIIFGIVLSGDGLKTIGIKQAMGYRFFSKEKLAWSEEGPYSFLKNPIYDGFIFIFIGLGLTLGIFLDFYLAGFSFLLLNLFLARIENKK